MRKDQDGEFWHIVAGGAIGAIINTSLTVASNIISGEKWNKGALTAAATGAVTGGLAASGAGVLAQVAANGAAGAVQEAVGNRKSATLKSTVAAGTVGAIAGRAGGRGAGNVVKKIGKQPVKKTIREFKHSKSLAKSFKTFKRSMSNTKKHTRYLFKKRDSGFRRSLRWGIIINGGYSAGRSFYSRR